MAAVVGVWSYLRPHAVAKTEKSEKVDHVMYGVKTLVWKIPKLVRTMRNYLDRGEINTDTVTLKLSSFLTHHLLLCFLVN